MKNEIFQRTQAPGQSRISSFAFNVLIGLTLLWGFAVNYLMVKLIPVEAVCSINPWVFLGGYFALCFGGIYLFNKSSKPLYSFIGYNMVVVPFGLCLNIFVSQYDPGLVLRAVRLTGIVTLSMMILGSIIPSLFESIIRPVSVILLLTIIFEFVFIGFFHITFAATDLIVAVLFCCYIGYDWGRANRIPKTVDNAIDCAAAIYMDVINLFMRILKVMGRGKK